MGRKQRRQRDMQLQLRIAKISLAAVILGIIREIIGLIDRLTQ